MQFFFGKRAFDSEVELYNNPVLAPIMPECFERSDNADGSLRAPSGYVFPPVMVFERGESLNEFAARFEHEPATVIQALVLVVKRVQVRFSPAFPVFWALFCARASDGHPGSGARRQARPGLLPPLFSHMLLGTFAARFEHEPAAVIQALVRVVKRVQVCLSAVSFRWFAVVSECT